MQKRAPTLANILVIAMFALSCFGLLLFLWDSFGGSFPLKPKGYRFEVSFSRTLQLAEQADVRISGVNVGHVVALRIDKDGRTHATVEMDSRYAPLRSDVHAILRQKTLLGETYVQIIPGSKTGPFIPEGGELANSQVESSVTLEDLFSAFDPATRHAWQVWMQSVAAGLNGRGEQVNAGFAALEPFIEHTNRLVTVMASQEGAVRGLVKNTGAVFSALAGRDHELEGLIVNGERTFHVTAQNSQAFADTWRALPGFETKSRVALKELDSFATDANPFLDQFRAAERQLAPTSVALKTFSPAFSSLANGLGSFTKASRRGLPAFSRSLNLLTPVLGNLSPVLRNLDPFLQYLGTYEAELQSFFANFTAATQGHNINANDSGAPSEHFIRTMQVVSPESLAVYPKRIGTNRGNPYPHAGAFRSLGSGLQVLNNSSCSNPVPSVSGPPTAQVPQSVIEQLIQFHVANAPESSNTVPAPACSQQEPFAFNGQTSQFPHVTATPTG